MDAGAGLLLEPLVERLAGSVALRPYVFAFLAVHLVAAAAAWGWRRALAFTVWAAGTAFAAEWTSTRVGVPFGLYHYTGETAGRELFLSNVPFFDSLSFSFLAFASLGLARHLLAWRDGRPAARAARWDEGGLRGAARLRLALTAGVLMMWLDLVIDPLAVRGDRWFLGRIFYYPEPGPYFGVPLANFAGWVVVGAVIVWGWEALGPRLGGRPPAWAARLPARAHHATLLYYLVLLFNLAVTAAVAEPALLGAGCLLHAPLAAGVVSSLRRHPSGLSSRCAPGPG
jgi:putative membrane protein